jgi:hypothetical protein
MVGILTGSSLFILAGISILNPDSDSHLHRAVCKQSSGSVLSPKAGSPHPTFGDTNSRSVGFFGWAYAVLELWN